MYVYFNSDNQMKPSHEYNRDYEYRMKIQMLIQRYITYLLKYKQNTGTVLAIEQYPID